MSQKSSALIGRGIVAAKVPAEAVVREIRQRARKQHLAEEKIRFVPHGLRGEDRIAAPYRCEAIAESLYSS